MQRCLGCMREFRDGFDICPHCGYEVGTPAASKNHLAPGTQLQKRYILGRVLGQGGFGITYVAWDTRLEKAVAVKEYMPSIFAARETGEKRVSCFNEKSGVLFKNGLARTLQESRNLAKFESVPGIVKVHDCIEENDTAYIIMELLRGETVKGRLKRQGKMSWAEVQIVMEPVFRALTAMHQEGVIHRDIAPDNIFLCEDGTVKLLDFGAARFSVELDDETRSITLKPGYAPFEQYSGHGNQGSWTDVYAACSTMYAMLTGVTPPDSPGRMGGEEITPLSDVVNLPNGVESAIMDGLKLQIKDRIHTIPELESRLQGQKKTPPKRRIPVIIAAVVMALLAVVVGVVAAFHKAPEEEPTETSTVEQTEAIQIVQPKIARAVQLNGEELKTTNADRSFGPEKTLDGNGETGWSVLTKKTGGAGASIRFELEEMVELSSFRIINGNQYLPEKKLYALNGQIKQFTVTFGDGQKKQFKANYNDGDPNGWQSFEFASVRTDSVTITVDSGYVGTEYPNNVFLAEFSVSEEGEIITTTEPETEQTTKPEASTWQRAYKDFLYEKLKDEDAALYGFDLCFIDDDDIPELAFSEGHARGSVVQILMFQNGIAKKIGETGAYGRFQYAKYQGVFVGEYGGSGEDYTDAFRMRGNEAVRFWRGIVREGYMTNFEKKFEANGKSVSEHEYETEYWENIPDGLSTSGWVIQLTEENIKKYIQ